MGRSPDRWVDRCVCGHVKDRHEVKVNAGRISIGGCDCGCPGFTAGKSGIEEGVAAPQAWPEESAYWTDDADGDPIIPNPPASELPPTASLAPQPDEDSRAWNGTVTSASYPEGTFVFSVADALKRAGAPRVVSSEELEELEELKRRFMAAQATDRMTVLTDHSLPLESFDAFRCAKCGSRSYRRLPCCGKIMDPVRVEIHSREAT